MGFSRLIQQALATHHPCLLETSCLFLPPWTTHSSWSGYTYQHETNLEGRAKLHSPQTSQKIRFLPPFSPSGCLDSVSTKNQQTQCISMYHPWPSASSQQKRHLLVVLHVCFYVWLIPRIAREHHPSIPNLDSSFAVPSDSGSSIVQVLRRICCWSLEAWLSSLQRLHNLQNQAWQHWIEVKTFKHSTCKHSETFWNIHHFFSHLVDDVFQLSIFLRPQVPSKSKEASTSDWSAIKGPSWHKSEDIQETLVPWCPMAQTRMIRFPQPNGTFPF